MNKKTAVLIIAVAVLLGGIIFWQTLSNQDTATRKASNVSACNSSNCDKPDKAKDNLVEIFYLPHAPAKAIVEKVDKILQKFPQYKIKEYDFYDDSNEQKVKNYNLLGHIPVAIFIGGTNTFLIDGQKITFKNFPKGDAFVPTLEGSWTYSDLEKVLANPNKYKND